jgi:hypothetical protein
MFNIGDFVTSHKIYDGKEKFEVVGIDASNKSNITYLLKGDFSGVGYGGISWCDDISYKLILFQETKPKILLINNKNLTAAKK